jgi:NarL family two-component system response regulator LiaR
MDKIRILIAEDHAVVREGFVAILSFQSDIDVIGQASDGLDAIQQTTRTKPDVLLLDLVMPRMDGLESIPKILNASPETKILVVTAYDDGEKVFQAIKSGALGYLLKDATRDQLLQAIRDVSQGQAFLYPSIALKVIQEINKPTDLSATTDPLTQRELETLKLIARGYSNQEIADTLVVNERTIAKYVSSILTKLHLANRTQAALYALREGLSDLEDEDKEKKDKVKER